MSTDPQSAWWSDHVPASRPSNAPAPPPPAPGRPAPSTGNRPANESLPRIVAVTAAVLAAILVATSLTDTPSAAPVAPRITGFESSLDGRDPTPDRADDPPVAAEDEDEAEEGGDEEPPPRDEPRPDDQPDPRPPEQPDAPPDETEEPPDDEPRPPAPDTRDRGDRIRPGVYDVVLSGSISGNAFERSGQIVVTETIDEFATENDVNALDVCLTSGFPAGVPEVGAIWFGTNSGCLPGTTATDLDMAWVTVDGSTITASPDERAMSVGVNHVTASNSLTALMYLVQAGAMQLEFGDGQVSGSIDFDVYCGPCTFGLGSDGARYQASITGRRA